MSVRASFRSWLACVVVLALAVGESAAESTSDQSLEELIERVQSKEGGIRPQGDRSTAIRELVRRGDLATADELVEIFADAYAHQREVLAVALSKCENAELLQQLLLRAQRHKDEIVRSEAVMAYATGKLDAHADTIVAMAADRSESVRVAVAYAIGAFARPGDAEALAALAKDRAPAVRQAAAAATLAAALPEYRTIAVDLLEDKDARVRSLAIEAAAAIAPGESVELIKAQAGDKLVPVRIGALLAWRHVAAGNDVKLFDEAVAATIAGLGDADWRVRATAIDNAVEIWDERFIEPIIALMKKEDGRLRLDCAFALTLLCNYDLGTDAGGWETWWQAQAKTFTMPKQPKRGDYGFRRSLAGSAETASFFDIPVLSKRCIFQFDFSGSMARELTDYRKDKNRSVTDDEKTTVTKLEIAQDEAEAVVDKLAPDAIFNFQIHRYEGVRNPPEISTEKPFKGLTPATPKARAEAKKWVRAREVSGWGAFYDALIEAIADDDVDTIFLLSDGVPSGGTRVEEDRFLRGIVEANRDRRVTIHSILLKNTDEKGHDKYAVSFMEDLADSTGGISVLR